jgi:S-adenosylmethionine:tRNA ribosyltransferase-isomerase
MRTSDFDYPLPPELIAQEPEERRDQSRLLVLDRASGALAHRHFADLLDYLRPGDVLVLNDSRVIPARLRGTNELSGGQFEILLVEEAALNDWWVMLRPGKRARIGTRIRLHDLKGQPTAILATVTEVNAEGHRRLHFEGAPNVLEALDALGEVPLPPYIARHGTEHMNEDRQRYQTVYARPPGSVAAPTAGLHFTEPLLQAIRAKGVKVCFLTLHVGLGTFAPVKADELSAHIMHEERYELSAETAAAINAAKQAGGRVIAVGTTSVRVLESVAAHQPTTAAPNSQRTWVAAEKGRTRIFIYPPYQFRVVDALVTNFHLPCSTLLMLISAFIAPDETRGRETALAAYAEAVRLRYRFFSYGDAMLLL